MKARRSVAMVGILAGVITLLAHAAPAAALPGCGTAGAINGTSGNDVLNGTSGANVICGHGGNDTIRGGGGNDVIYGGSGNDVIYAGSGNDVVHGDSGADLVKGESGNDTLYGDAGNDSVYGDQDNDTLLGGPDADKVWGGPGADKIEGEGGNDTLNGESGNDRLSGGSGTDMCAGGGGYADTINDFNCERRSGAERLSPAWNSNDTSCGPDDTSCLTFAGYSGQSVAGYPVCRKHNCTNYGAYRLAKRGLTKSENFPRGNAHEWNNRPGVLASVSASSPAVSDIAQWESFGGPSNRCGSVNCGHVATVERLNYDANGKLVSIVVSQSSWCTGGSVKTIAVGSSLWPSRFLRWNR